MYPVSKKIELEVITEFAESISTSVKIDVCDNFEYCDALISLDLFQGIGLTFYSGADINELQHYQTTPKGLIICSLDEAIGLGKNVIIVEKAQAFYAQLIHWVCQNDKTHEVHPSVAIHPNAVLGSNISIGANSNIGKAIIGNNVRIAANVTICDEVEIGDHTEIFAGAVIGERGLGSIINNTGKHILFPHVGKTIIGKHVVIGASTVVNRGALSNTVISDHCHVSAKTLVAHNCFLENNVFVSAGVTICGTVHIGSGSYIGAGSCLKEACTIASDCTIGLGVIVSKSIEESGTVLINQQLPRSFKNNFFGLKR